MKILSVSLVLGVLSSCTVLNNLYVNDPNPVGKGNNEMYFGVGSGLRPVIDDITNEGDLIFSGDVSMAPNFIVGGLTGLGKQLDIRACANFPKSDEQP